MRALFLGAAHWLVILWVICFITNVTCRPSTSQPSQSTPSSLSTTPNDIEKNNSSSNGLETSTTAGTSSESISRDEKTNTPAIGESIQMVANQLLQGNKTPPPATGEGGVVEDVRTPPRMKNQQNNKIKNNKLPTSTTSAQIIETSHAGVAVPMDADEIEKPIDKPNKAVSYINKLSTTDEGISTWILLSGNPTTPQPKNPNKNNLDQNKSSAEVGNMDKNEANDEVVENDIKKTPEVKQRPKPTSKPARRTTTVAPKPIFTRKPVAIGSSNKSDLIASGSAVNEKVMNKIKASVLANVQKNKFAALNRTTTSTSLPIVEVTSTVAPAQDLIENSTTEKSMLIKTSTVSSSPKVDKIKVSVAKPHKTKPQSEPNENVESKHKVMEKDMEIQANDIAVESKETEIELEVSTPAPVTTKKPKRTSNKRKKNKNRRRSKPSTTEIPNTAIESKNNNNTKLASKIAQKEKPITTQIYNYLSREVMPTVGVGLVSIAGLVGLASYFLYPFSGVVRRAYDVNDRKDDLYQQNGEQYATAEGGQTEEEMLGSFFPEEPNPKKTNKNSINPYAGQTQFKYPPVKKSSQDQNIRYRNVAHGSDTNSFIPSDRVGQHSSDQIQGAAYAENIHYDTHMPEDDEKYSSVGYQHPHPVYKSSDLNTEEVAYGSDSIQATYSTQDKITDPTYGQAIRYGQEIAINDETKSPDIETLHLGVDDVIEKQKETEYTVAAVSADDKQPQFVVGNVPKELIQAASPITVPEHGPRSLNIKKRSILASQQNAPIHISSTAESLREIFKKSNETESDIDFSNEISDSTKETTLKYQSTPVVSMHENKPLKDKENLFSTFDMSTSGMKMYEDEKIPINYGKEDKLNNNVKKEDKKKENNFDKVAHINTKTMNKLSKDEKSKIDILTDHSTENQHTSKPKVDAISISDIGNFLTTKKYGSLETTSKVNDDIKKSENIITSTSLPIKEDTVKKLGTVDSKDSTIVATMAKAGDAEIIDSGKVGLSPISGNIFIEVSTKNDDSTDAVPTFNPLAEPTTYKTESSSYASRYPEPDEYPNTDPFEGQPKPFSILGFLKSLVEFKIRLGMSILQSTSDSLARYLRNMESSLRSASRDSKHVNRPYYNNK